MKYVLDIVLTAEVPSNMTARQIIADASDAIGKKARTNYLYREMYYENEKTGDLATVMFRLRVTTYYRTGPAYSQKHWYPIRG